MYQQEYYVPKSSSTLADSLLAYGLAALLQVFIEKVPGHRRHGYRVSIQDKGAYYLVHLPEPILAEWVEAADKIPPLAKPILRVAKPRDETKAEAKPKPEKKAFPEGLVPIDYNEVWEKIRKANALVAEQLKQRGRMRREEIQQLRESQGSQEYRDVALLIGDYRMQVEGIHNQAVRQWFDTVEAGYQTANLQTILQLFASPQVDIGAITKAWASEVKIEGVKLRLTASQVFNPSMGKGQNRAKADQLSMGNEEYFWLIEYLKAVGLFVAAAPRAFTDENMRKTYVLAPANIELATHEAIFKRFERTLDGLGVSPIKADILTSLDYASAYLSYWAEARLEEGQPPTFNPRNSINGFYVATYVLLSKNSFTLINLSFLGLPPWLSHFETGEDVTIVQEVIEEQEKLIRPLQEKHQEGSRLLEAYRDFLTGHRLDAFFDFCTGYGEYAVRTLPENPFIRQCSIASLDQIFRRISVSEQDNKGANDLTEFASASGQHPGFHHIAYAIRHSTVIPQRQNANYKLGKRAEKSLYDVRYGLGNSLRRKTDSGEFMEALTEFLQTYNAETEQVFEKTVDEYKKDPQNYARNHYRKRVSISDLDDVLELAKDHGPRLVCNMLVAYGYASTGKGSTDETDTGEGEFGEDSTDEVGNK